jgi:hypothetical protein
MPQPEGGCWWMNVGIMEVAFADADGNGAGVFCREERFSTPQTAKPHAGVVSPSPPTLPVLPDTPASPFHHRAPCECRRCGQGHSRSAKYERQPSAMSPGGTARRVSYSVESSGGACARSGDIPVADLATRSAILAVAMPKKVRRYARIKTATGMSPLLVPGW